LLIQRSIPLENRVNRRINDKTVECQADKENSNKSQDIRNMSERQKLREWVGFGYAATAVLASMIGGARAETPPGTALVPRDDRYTTGLPPALVQKEFNHPSPETAQHNALRELGMTDQQIREVMQREHQIKQKYYDRQLAKQANSDDYLDGLTSLFKEESNETFDDETKQFTSNEKIATVRAVAEEASEIANRVTQVIAARRLLSEQKSIAEAPQGNSAEAPQKSNETEQKDTGILCLDGSATKVGYDLTEESLTIIANLETVNTCDNTIISKVYFDQNALITCPADCTPSGITRWMSPGNPSSIGFAGVSTAGNIDAVSCTTSDGNNIAPISVILEVQPIGFINGYQSFGTQEDYKLP
jgi:hypothetical protein